MRIEKADRNAKSDRQEIVDGLPIEFVIANDKAED